MPFWSTLQPHLHFVFLYFYPSHDTAIYSSSSPMPLLWGSPMTLVSLYYTCPINSYSLFWFLDVPWISSFFFIPMLPTIVQVVITFSDLYYLSFGLICSFLIGLYIQSSSYQVQLLPPSQSDFSVLTFYQTTLLMKTLQCPLIVVMIKIKIILRFGRLFRAWLYLCVYPWQIL